VAREHRRLLRVDAEVVQAMEGAVRAVPEEEEHDCEHERLPRPVLAEREHRVVRGRALRRQQSQRQRDPRHEDERRADERRDHPARAEEQPEDRLDGSRAHASTATMAMRIAEATTEATRPPAVIAFAPSLRPATTTGGIVFGMMRNHDHVWYTNAAKRRACSTIAAGLASSAIQRSNEASPCARRDSVTTRIAA